MPAPTGNIDLEELFSWLDQQPELAAIREQAASTVCAYKPGEATPSARIECNPHRELRDGRKGMLAKLFEIVWVPGRSMRGDAFSTPELDQSLNSVAKLMCISTLWDFFCTIPLFQFSLSGPLGAAAFPGATILSFLLLWASNVAGENATDRRPRHATRANWSLAAFVLLCTAKTMVSGAGVDLWIGSKGIASTYATELAQKKLSDDKQELTAKKSTSGEALIKANNECKYWENVQQSLDRQTQEREWVSAYRKARGTNLEQAAMQGLTPEQMIQKYGDPSFIPGACNQAKALQFRKDQSFKKLEDAVSLRSTEINRLPSLDYLQKYEGQLFRQHFYFQNGKLEWVNGTEAVGQSLTQFYRGVGEGKFGLLGFSLFTLAVSVILTGAASIMIYLTGGNPQVHASYTGELKQFRDRRLSDYAQLLRKEG